jgi:hypothetical protein
MIRSKLENQMKEINKLKILLEHHELPPIMKANVTIQRTLVIEKPKIKKLKILREIDITPKDIDTKHGTIMAREVERMNMEKRLNEEHLKNAHRRAGVVDYKTPVQQAPYEGEEENKLSPSFAKEEPKEIVKEKVKKAKSNADGASSTGPSAATGAIESTSTTGSTGTAEPTGSTGATGIEFSTSTGMTGTSTGMTGLTGATGLTSETGIDATGATGSEFSASTGMTGLTGATGLTGVGATGPTPPCLCPAWKQGSLLKFGQKGQWSGPSCGSIGCKMSTSCVENKEKSLAVLKCLTGLCNGMAKTYGSGAFNFCSQVQNVFSSVAFEFVKNHEVVGAKTSSEAALLDINENVTWTTYTTNFKPAAPERKAKQDEKTKKQVDNLIKYMNVNKGDTAFLEVNNDKNVTWTTYTTNFKPAAPERKAKQDEKTKKQVDNLIKYMNVNKGDTAFLEVNNDKNVTWTTYTTNFKPAAPERKAKQDEKTKKQVDNLIKYMN